MATKKTPTDGTPATPKQTRTRAPKGITIDPETMDQLRHRAARETMGLIETPGRSPRSRTVLLAAADELAAKLLANIVTDWLAANPPKDA